MSEHLRNAARAIFRQALQAVDVDAAVRREVLVGGGTLTLAGRSLPLADVDEVVIVALGKAAVAMYRASAEALCGVPCRAIVVAPSETLPKERGDSAAEFLPGAHPTPTADSLHAAARILEALRRVTPRCAVLFLVSGGASAMVEQPLEPAITLEDVATFSRTLVGSGLNITAMNTLRKHLSAVKGGRLAEAAAAAAVQCTLLISDVPAASPDAIASGPSLPDSSSVEDTRALFDTLRRGALLPQRIVDWFEAATLPETPKSTSPAFRNAHWRVLLSSEVLARAAKIAAEAAGFHAEIDNSCDDLDYRDAGVYLLQRAEALARDRGTPFCMISVGEVAVTLSQTPGEGGRNQQFALWCAEALARSGRSATILSAGSDGIDGHSAAAGAACDETTPARAEAAGLSVMDALSGFSTTPLLRAVGDAIQIGPTGNNLRDVRLILIDRIG